MATILGPGPDGATLRSRHFMLSIDNNRRARDTRISVAAARHLEGVFFCLGSASGGSPPLTSALTNRANLSPGPTPSYPPLPQTTRRQPNPAIRRNQSGGVAAVVGADARRPARPPALRPRRPPLRSERTAPSGRSASSRSGRN